MKRLYFNCKMTNGLSIRVDYSWKKRKIDRRKDRKRGAHPFKRVAGWNFQEINAFGAKTAGFLYARLLYFHSTHASKRFLGAWNTRKWVKDRGYVEFSGNFATLQSYFDKLAIQIYGWQVFLIEDIRKG